MSDNQNIVYSFMAYLEKISGRPAYLEKIDWGATELPMWNILLDPKWNFATMDDTNGSLNIVVKVQLICDIKSPRDALTIMLRTLPKINKFDYSSGSMIGAEEESESGTGLAEIETEKNENNLILSFSYKLKIAVQDTV